MCYCPTPTLHLNLALTGDGAFLFSLKKTHSVWLISVLNYGDTENVLINHLLLVIPMSYPCHYTNLCPHKPHKHAHTHTHTHTKCIITNSSLFVSILSSYQRNLIMFLFLYLMHFWQNNMLFKGQHGMYCSRKLICHLYYPEKVGSQKQINKKKMSICKIFLNDKTVKCRINVPIHLVRYSVFYIIRKYIL